MAKKTSRPIIAHVGAHPGMTERDLGNIVMAMEAAGPDLWPRNPTTDIINLEAQGRDFLKEKIDNYDTVVVHSVFHTNDTFLSTAKADPVMGRQISPLHSAEAWCKRLAKTGARMIILLETIPFSLGGWHVGRIPGYTIKTRTHQVTVYVRRFGKQRAA